MISKRIAMRISEVSAAILLLASMPTGLRAQEAAERDSSQRRPNLILLMTDQHRADCVGARLGADLRLEGYQEVGKLTADFPDLSSVLPLPPVVEARDVDARHEKTFA